MNPRFYLFLPKRSNALADLTSAALSWVYEDANKDLKLAHGLLKDAAVAALNHHITVVLPGEDVLFLSAEVPGKNIHHIQQAIPYVLEDNVIDDVDELHFAIKKKNSEQSGNQYTVSVINKDYFESVIAELKNADIQADAMIADYMLLADNNTLFFDGEKIVFNGNRLKFTSAIDSLDNFEKDILNENNDINLIYSAEETTGSTRLDNLIENNNIRKEQYDIHPLLCLVKNSSNESTVNLLQGSYKKKKNWSETGKTWLPVAILFLVWLSVQGGLFIFEYINLSKQNKALTAEITKIYKKSFPESRRVIDAKAQMKEKLNSLKKRKGQSGRSFSEMLSGSASVFANTKGLKIQSLRYYDGRINLEIQIPSLQALDKLKSQLNEEKGYQVEVQNASSGKETVTARMKISGAES